MNKRAFAFPALIPVFGVLAVIFGLVVVFQTISEISEPSEYELYDIALIEFLNIKAYLADSVPDDLPTITLSCSGYLVENQNSCYEEALGKYEDHFDVDLPFSAIVEPALTKEGLWYYGYFDYASRSETVFLFKPIEFFFDLSSEIKTRLSVFEGLPQEFDRIRLCLAGDLETINNCGTHSPGQYVAGQITVTITGDNPYTYVMSDSVTSLTARYDDQENLVLAQLEGDVVEETQ